LELNRDPGRFGLLPGTDHDLVRGKRRGLCAGLGQEQPPQGGPGE
jgi:hypothetical protein